MPTTDDSRVDRMRQMLSTGEDADVHFLVGVKKEKCSAHKAILRAASNYFGAMFRFDAKNADYRKEQNGASSEVIDVPDVEVDAFKAMLLAIYADDMSGLNADNLIPVLYAAKKCSITGLEKACLEFPKSKLRNVFLVFAETRLLHEDLASRCLAYIDWNADTLVQSEAFLEIDRNLLCYILDRDQLRMSEEIVIWNAALCWADKQCRQNGKECSAKNRRTALGSALYKIRFPLIPLDDFSKQIVPSGVLTDQEVIRVYLSYKSSDIVDVQPKSYPLQFVVSDQRRNARFAMKIEKFSELARTYANANERCSVGFYMAGFVWRILAYSRTNDSNGQKYLSFFLKCDNFDGDAVWSVNCSATLAIVSQQTGGVVNKVLGALGIVRTTDFTRKFKTSYSNTIGQSWGYDEFISFEYLMDPRNGLYRNDTVILSVDVTVDEPRGADG